MKKITSVDKDNLEAIAIGGAVLGSGGGGDPYVGRLMTNQILEKAQPVKVIEVETLNDDELITIKVNKKIEYDVTRKNWGFYSTPSINKI